MKTAAPHSTSPLRNRLLRVVVLALLFVSGSSLVLALLLARSAITRNETSYYHGLSAVMASLMRRSLEISDYADVQRTLGLLPRDGGVTAAVVTEDGDLLLGDYSARSNPLVSKIPNLKGLDCATLERAQGPDSRQAFCSVILGSPSGALGINERLGLSVILLTAREPIFPFREFLLTSCVLLTSLVALSWLTRIYLTRLIVEPLEVLRNWVIQRKRAPLAPPSEDKPALEVTEMQELLQAFGELLVAIQSESELRRHSESRLAVQDLARQVAHDIRAPVAALEEALPEIDRLDLENGALIRGASLRIRAIAEELLQATRAGTTPRTAAPTAEVTDVRDVVREILHEKASAFAARGAVSEFDLPPIEALVKGSRTGLARIVSNLVDNSLHSLAPGGRVRISVTTEGGTHFLSIVDSGNGIPQDVLPQLGTRGATFAKEGGTGLGLFHARTTVESWGGRLEIQSEVGKGTTVRLILPRAEPPPVAQAANAGATVLIDDDPLVRMNWTVAAKRAGKALKAYPNAASFIKEAGECARETPIYIDSDLGEGVKGEEAAKELLALGFTELRLATGHDPASFPPLPHIKAIQGKEPPWTSA